MRRTITVFFDDNTSDTFALSENKRPTGSVQFNLKRDFHDFLPSHQAIIRALLGMSKPHLEEFSRQKVQSIKNLRMVYRDLGLKEAKDIVDYVAEEVKIPF